MANKAFEIQESKLRIGGLDLEAGATAIVVPGLSQAVTYFVEEVDERDGNNPSGFGNSASAVTIIDNAEYLVLSGTTPSASYTAAEYSVDEIDDGEIDDINVEVAGVFDSADKTRAESANMWATTVGNPFDNFNINDWTQIPFRPRMRADDVTNVSGASSLEELNDVEIDGPSNGQVLTWNNDQEKWENQDPSSGNVDLGNFKILGGILGTQGENSNDWGSFNINIDPGGESYAYIYLPSVANQNDGESLQLHSYATETSQIHLFGRGGVQITTTDNDNNPKVFEFDNRGAIRLPEGGDILNSSGNSVLGGSSTHIEYTDDESGYTSTVDLTYDFKVDVDNSHLDINGDGTWEIGSNRFDTKIFSRAYELELDPLNVVIQANNLEWTFDSLGILRLPQNGDIVDANGESVLGGGSGATIVARQDTPPTAANGTLWFNTLEGRLYIKYSNAWVDAAPLMMPAPDTDIDVASITFPDASVQTSAFSNKLVNGASELVLDEMGFLTVPASIVLSEGVITFMGEADPGIVLGSSINSVFVRTLNGIDQYEWKFGTDGAVSFPYQSTNNRTGSANALVFAKSNSQKAISTQSGDVDNQTVERLVIAGGDSYYDANENEWFGEGGDVYIYGGAGGNGGDIKVDAGNALGLNSDEGGTIKIRAGQSQTGDGGFIEITGGYGINQNGGDIAITGGQGALIGGNVTITGGIGDNTHGKVRLSTRLSTDNSVINWDFDTNGALILPDGVSSISSLDPAQSGGINGVALSGKDRAFIGINNESFGYSWDFRAFGGSGSGSTVKPAIQFPGGGWLQEDATDIVDNNVPVQLGSQGSITLTTKFNDILTPAEHSWVFGRDGALTLPSGAGFGLGEIGQLKVNDGVTVSLDLRDSSGRGFYTNSDGFSIRGNGNNTWKFGTDGNLTIPGDGQIIGSNVTVKGSSSVSIKTTSSINPLATRDWTFGTDGSLRLPDAGIVKVGVDTAQVGSTQTIATNGSGGLDSGYNSNTLVVAYDANIISTYTAGSTITFQDGVVATITEIADYGPTSIDIGWDTPKTGTLFPITLKTANYVAATLAPEWEFGTDGGLTFPDATVQTTAYIPAGNVIKTTGTWTVTPGTANYSFTVTPNSVYQLWVRGNVPNGIISYTATAHVTNTNVPVLGTQYAWNYTGAGNPILFTALPTQFIGTEGAISTSNPSVGTSTNTFVFGLSNSTAENVTIQWGYTKIS